MKKYVLTAIGGVLFSTLVHAQTMPVMPRPVMPAQKPMLTKEQNDCMQKEMAKSKETTQQAKFATAMKTCNIHAKSGVSGTVSDSTKQ